MNLKSIFIAALFCMSANAFAGSESGTFEAAYAHDHYTYLFLNGDGAKSMYQHLGVKEVDEHGGSPSQKIGTSKISADGRMWCFKRLDNVYQCHISFDSTTGSIYQVWTPNP